MSSQSPLLPRFRLFLTCCSIAANALLAGGIFTFPLLSPSLALHLKLTQPQLTTIVLSGMMGQYPFSAFAGKVIDRHGPWATSLVASALFSTGFGLFAWEISKTPDDIAAPSQSSFRHLTLCFFMAGLGTVFSYFSFLFAASKSFPSSIGFASGASTALFGLSPLFLSFVASTFFTDPVTGLNVTKFLTFLAITAGSVHFVGAFNLRLPSTVSPTALEPQETTPLSDNDVEGQSGADERDPLLPHKPRAEVTVVPVEEDGSALDLLRDPQFWWLACIVMITLGSCEMVVSNIGTIVLSLPGSSSTAGSATFNPSTDAATSKQVRLLSLASTLSRLLSGPLADFVSPVASHLPGGAPITRKHFVSRVGFLSGATLLLAGTFTALEIVVKSQDDLWLLSVGTGVVYGTTFTIMPSLISSIWGHANFGRNFGILTYAPFVGTPIFSYLYAFISAAHAGGEGVCVGHECWRLTFWIGVGTAFIACAVSLGLWRQWKGRV
ncbi:MFS general substrate transporter [Auriscalpium vulgare]|uniref:MFS general substrate transporter n=1 Tax=Auriscalpium vulgare TaxID=40419 RepID=A0ACB8S3R3_9AGAM|nr:MFS general substrate transporter [Auriscalpium vulgare]